MHKNHLSGHFMALVCVLIWGSTFVVTKDLMGILLPLQLILLRYALAYAALWLIHPKWYFKWREEWRFLVMALFANTLYSWAENTALSLTQASNVSILVSTSPLVTALILAVFCKEKLGHRQLTGFTVAFLGVILVVFNGAFALHLKPVGDMLALTAAVLWAAYGMLLRRWSDEYNSLLITRKLLFYGLLTVAPMVLISGEPINFAAVLTFSNIAKIAYLSLMGSALGYILWNNAVSRIGVLSANMYIYMIPLVTLIVSAVFLNEKLTLMGFAGIIMVISGMVFASWQKKDE